MLQNYRFFEKRKSEQEQHIYISTPTCFLNRKGTNFIDLSQQNKEPEKEG